MKTYRTGEVAHRNGIHPNTVRLYEELALIPRPEREPNGYRVFTDLHMDQIRLARTALRVEVLQNGLRKRVVDIIKTSARGDFARAVQLTRDYLGRVGEERKRAEEAIAIAGQMLSGKEEGPDRLSLGRREAAGRVDVSIDTLRNWEMNGLLAVKRRRNGYRVYTDEDLRRLRMIRVLRCANYSLAAILRMISALSRDPESDLRRAIDTPQEGEDIISACDKLLTSLRNAGENGQDMLVQLRRMEKKYNSNPPL